MEKRTIRSGAPFAAAGAAALGYALIFGAGTIPGYLALALCGAAGYALGRRAFPDRVIEVERAPRSGDAQVDALIAEARAQLAQIAAANEAIAEAQLSAQIEDIEATCRSILARLEAHPGMAASLRTFLRYYLPVTLKLLGERAALEREVEAGQSAAIAQRIREAMAQVQEAFHKQLEALEHYRFISLESEMDVLADMLRQDGLTGGAQEDAARPQDDIQAKDEARDEGGGEEDPFAGLFAREK